MQNFNDMFKLYMHISILFSFCVHVQALREEQIFVP